MSLKFYLSAIICYFFTIVSVDAFEVGENPAQDMGRTIYANIAADLLVGDQMRVGRNSFCVHDKKLMLLGDASQAEWSNFYAEFVVTIEAGSRASITIRTDHLDDPDRSDVQLFIWECNSSLGTELIPVVSINGFVTLEGYLKSDFVTSLPIP